MASEKLGRADVCVRCYGGNVVVIGGSRQFTFDAAFDRDTSQQIIYQRREIARGYFR